MLTLLLQNNLCIQGNFNTNISYRLFSYKITFVNSQHENTNSKCDFVIKNWVSKFVFKISGKYTKLNLSKKYIFPKITFDKSPIKVPNNSLYNAQSPYDTPPPPPPQGKKNQNMLTKKNR